jgi:hypothetical protein
MLTSKGSFLKQTLRQEWTFRWLLVWLRGSLDSNEKSLQLLPPLSTRTGWIVSPANIEMARTQKSYAETSPRVEMARPGISGAGQKAPL